VLTGYGTIATARHLGENGRRHYLSKPADADDVVRPLLRRTEKSELPNNPMSADRCAGSTSSASTRCGNRQLSEPRAGLNMHRRTLPAHLRRRAPRNAKRPIIQGARLVRANPESRATRLDSGFAKKEARPGMTMS